MGPGLQGSQASTSRLVCFGGEVTPRKTKQKAIALLTRHVPSSLLPQLPLHLPPEVNAGHATMLG